MSGGHCRGYDPRKTGPGTGWAANSPNGLICSTGCCPRKSLDDFAGRSLEVDKLLGPRGYLDRPEDLALYEYDGSVDKARPELVVFPETAEQRWRWFKLRASTTFRLSGAAPAPVSAAE